MLIEQKLALFSSVALLLLSVFFSQTIAPSSEGQLQPSPSHSKQEKSNNTRSTNYNPITKPMLILTFDDNWTGQIKYVKPILEKYKLNATFFINCNIINKDRAPSLYAPVQRGKIMTCDDISELKKAGFDIQSHGMNHDKISLMSQSQLDYEIGDSKQCLLDHGVNSTVFATPFSEGTQNKTIISTVAKWFQIGRAGYGDVMYLKCDQYKEHPQIDCRTYDEHGMITYANRFNIRAWNHNGLDSQFGHESVKVFQEFIKKVTAGFGTNNLLSDETVLLIMYHNVEDLQKDNVPPQWIKSTTDAQLFDQEMKYLSEHHFKTPSMADIGYNHTVNMMYIKS